MKVRYIGETFYGGLGLTNNKIYKCIEIDEEFGCLRVIDDDEDAVFYPITNPRPADGSSVGGKWEIVEDINGKLNKIFKEFKLI